MPSKKLMGLPVNDWIDLTIQSPPVSYVESDNPSAPYEAHMVLFYVPDFNDRTRDEILVGYYEEEVLSPFPNIPRFLSWNGWDSYELEFSPPTHWMQLPKSPRGK
jgi:hypothetical protein